MNESDNLHLSLHIPTLVYAASWFARAFSLRVSAAEVHELTVSAAIETRLPEDMKVGGLHI